MIALRLQTQFVPAESLEAHFRKFSLLDQFAGRKITNKVIRFFVPSKILALAICLK